MVTRWLLWTYHLFWIQGALFQLWLQLFHFAEDIALASASLLPILHMLQVVQSLILVRWWLWHRIRPLILIDNAHCWVEILGHHTVGVWSICNRWIHTKRVRCYQHMVLLCFVEGRYTISWVFFSILWVLLLDLTSSSICSLTISKSCVRNWLGQELTILDSWDRVLVKIVLRIHDWCYRCGLEMLHLSRSLGDCEFRRWMLI